MKKLFSFILISFILFTNLVVPISVFGEETVWNYTETATQKIHGPFTTEALCVADRTSLSPQNLIPTSTCQSSIIAGLPIPKPDPAIPVTPKINVAENKSIYTMLAPIGGITRMDSSGTDATCAADPKCITNDIGKYLNIIFKLAIGVSAALAVIMLIINGITYMGDESIFAKTEAKSKMFSAILGLLIALGSWALLNTISPALTGKGGFTIDTANIEIQNFSIPAALTFDGKPIEVNFNKKAYPAAKIASQKTGVDTAFILAIFSQETGGGANTGRCSINDNKANMFEEDKVALKTITTELGKDINTTPVSCSLLKGDGSFNGHGGAIGLTQFRPTTWLENREAARLYLGHMPDPWNPEDALMMTAVYLKKMGGSTNQQEAACKYFGGPGISCGTNAGIANYGNSVLGKKVSIQKQIDESIKKGEIQ